MCEVGIIYLVYVKIFKPVSISYNSNVFTVNVFKTILMFKSLLFVYQDDNEREEGEEEDDDEKKDTTPPETVANEKNEAEKEVTIIYVFYCALKFFFSVHFNLKVIIENEQILVMFLKSK